MRFRVLLAGASAVVLAAVVAGRADADNETTPSVKQIMAKLHKGANAPLGKLKGELKAQQPDWDDIQKQAKQIVLTSAALVKNEPPKGDPASWKKLCDAYYQDAKALEDAAGAKDLAAAKTAHGRLSASCKGCHSAHKGK
jgi:cytochrome c556